MSPNRSPIIIAVVGIVMQIVTGIVVVNVAIEVIRTKLQYTEDEIFRLRQWREQVVDPKMAEHSSEIELLRDRLEAHTKPPGR